MTIRRLKPRKPPKPRNIAAQVIKERCATAFYDRVDVLEQIADGALGWSVTTDKQGKGKTITAYEPTARDRVAALETLAKYGGIGADDGNPVDGAQWRTQEALARAVVGALSDPAVRRWMLEERPELLGALVSGAVSGGAEKIPDPLPAAQEGEFEVVGVLPVPETDAGAQ